MKALTFCALAYFWCVVGFAMLLATRAPLGFLVVQGVLCGITQTALELMRIRDERRTRPPR